MRRNAYTQDDVNTARMMLADYEDGLPVKEVVNDVTRAAVIRTLNHLLAVSMANATATEVRDCMRRHIRELGGEVHPTRLAGRRTQ